MSEPTIIIGLGGQGSAIALSVKQRLEAFARVLPDPEDELARIQRSIWIMAIDTDNRTGIHDQFTAEHKAILRPGTPDRLIREREANQLEWWPKHISAPGGFHKGAGGIRSKGRLAYYLAGGGIPKRVNDAIKALRAAHAGAGDGGDGGAIPVFVYLVGSLSGGTGSGIMLTLAMHLRQHINDDDTTFIGVIPMSSIMERGPTNYMVPNIWANCSAGLRELEWWMTPPELRLAQIEPFFRMGVDNIDGQHTPFDLCYLFMDTAGTGRPLASFRQYTEFIADCIAMDVYSPAAAGNQSLISNMFADMLDLVAPPNTQVCKPVRFASAGSAAVVFSPLTTTAYLGDRLLASVINEFIRRRPGYQDDAPKEEPVAQMWLELRGVLRSFASLGALHVRLRAPRQNQNGKLISVSGRRSLDLEGVQRGDLRAEILKRKADFATGWLSPLKELAELNRQPVTDSIWDELVQYTQERLRGNPGDILRSTADFLLACGRLLMQHQAALLTRRDDSESRESGLKGRQETLNKDLEPALRRLTDQRGSPEARRKFITDWWDPYTEVLEESALIDAEIHIVGDLKTNVEKLSAAIEQVLLSVDVERKRLSDGLKSRFSRRAGWMALEDRVLNDRKLIDYVFPSETTPETLRQSTFAISLARGICESDGDIWDWIFETSQSRNRLDDEKRAQLSTAVQSAIATAQQSASGQFSDRVEQLSVWDAMEREFYARNYLRMTDQYLEQIGGFVSDPAAFQPACHAYIAARVAACKASAAPLWRIDQVSRDRHLERFRSRETGTVAYSPTPFDNQADPARIAMKTMISGILGDLGDPAPTSRHHLFVSRREWGIPIMLLEHAELKRLHDNEREWTASRGHVYLDQRYVEHLPADFELDTVERKLKEIEGDIHPEILALAIGMNFVRQEHSSASLNGTGPFEASSMPDRSVYHHMASDIFDALNQLSANQDMFMIIQELVEGEWKRMTSRDQTDMLTSTISWIKVEMGKLGFSRDGRRDALTAMRDAAQKRLDSVK